MWTILEEKAGIRRLSTKLVAGVEIRRIEVWSTGKTGRTYLGTPAVGTWKVRGYRVGGKFFARYADAVKSAKE